MSIRRSTWVVSTNSQLTSLLFLPLSFFFWSYRQALFTLKINFEIYVNWLLMQENFWCEQSTFERNKLPNFISQFRTCSILQNFFPKKFHLWSAVIGHLARVYKHFQPFLVYPRRARLQIRFGLYDEAGGWRFRRF